MYKAFLILCTCLALIGGSSCEKRDTPVLPPDSVLVEILTDLHLAEAALSRVSAAKQDSVAAILRARIAYEHQVEPAELDLWLESLQKSPEHMISLYDSVIAKLEKQIPND